MHSRWRLSGHPCVCTSCECNKGQCWRGEGGGGQGYQNSDKDIVIIHGEKRLVMRKGHLCGLEGPPPVTAATTR
jgi:hypothetical protein